VASESFVALLSVEGSGGFEEEVINKLQFGYGRIPKSKD
jgi:hypothetical protein